MINLHHPAPTNQPTNQQPTQPTQPPTHHSVDNTMKSKAGVQTQPRLLEYVLLAGTGMTSSWCFGGRSFVHLIVSCRAFFCLVCCLSSAFLSQESDWLVGSSLHSIRPKARQTNNTKQASISPNTHDALHTCSSGDGHRGHCHRYGAHPRERSG